jgi:alkylation response protein AidB-like acyl-CoA dehydrogenase
MLELGWQGVWVAEADGGFGGSLVDVAAIADALARQAIAAPLIARSGVVPAILSSYAAEPAVRALLQAHSDGQASICPVTSTSGLLPGDPAVPRLDAEFRLSGTLSGVDQTEPASHLLFIAKSPDGLAHLVLTRAAALLAASQRYSSNDGRRFADLRLDGLNLPAAAVLARGSAAEQAMAKGHAVGALLNCVETVGSAAGLLEHTIAYLNTRMQFGVALSSFQALRHRAVEMYVAYENAFGLVRHLIQTHASGPLSLTQVFTAKLYLASVGRMIGEAAIQLHGGMGMATETLASRLAVRSITGTFEFGDRAQCLDWLSGHTEAKAA